MRKRLDKLLLEEETKELISADTMKVVGFVDSKGKNQFYKTPLENNRIKYRSGKDIYDREYFTHYIAKEQ